MMMAGSHLTVARRPSLQEGTHFQTVRVIRTLMVAGLCVRLVNGAPPASRKWQRRVYHLVARTRPFAAPADESGHYVHRVH